MSNFHWTLNMTAINLPRRHPARAWCLTWLSLAAGALVTHQAMAQGAYPNKPIRMIVPLAAGSAVDNAARIVTLKMGQNMGQSFVIDRKSTRLNSSHLRLSRMPSSA